MVTASQEHFAYRFGWGLDGLRTVGATADVIVIVDVLRFTSAVSAAVESGVTVLPYLWKDDRAAAFAAQRDAVLAGMREDGGPSLSPTDLLTLPSGMRIVLPSPNGATLSVAARSIGRARVLAGCLRNATATARYARKIASNGAVAVIASGERWRHDDSLRPSFEDLVGAGAVLAALDPSSAVAAPCCSPEAGAARAAFQFARPRLDDLLLACESGQELAGWGWLDDIATSAALDVTDFAAELVGDEFRRAR